MLGDFTFNSIRQIVTQELKINLLNAFLNFEKTAYVSVEYENKMNQIASFNFDKKGIIAVCKSLTNKNDLDKRKVRISRPITGRIEIKLIEQALFKFGCIEELYEVKNNPRKRTFVAAFINEEHKLKILKMKSLFIGSKILKLKTLCVSQNLKNQILLLKFQIFEISIQNSLLTVCCRICLQNIVARDCKLFMLNKM